MKKKTKELSLCASMAALGVTFLLLGGILPFATFAAPLLSSLTLVMANTTCQKKYCWCCYVSIAILSFLLCNDKEAVLMFWFLGYYPLLQETFDKVQTSFGRISLKLLFVLTAISLDYAMIIYVLRLQEVVEELSNQSPFMLLSMLLLGVITFFLFDIICRRFDRKLRRSK